MRTTADGPVVISEKTLRALWAIRRAKLLAPLYGQVMMARSVCDLMADVFEGEALPPWLAAVEDHADVELPARVASAGASDAATLRLALGVGASLVLLEEPIKERAKLSFIKAEGTVSILVLAYRLGHQSSVRPMLVALEKLGHGHVLPPPDQLAALEQALDQLGP